MNDRFKFRAWDKSFCRMIYNIFFFCKENKITVYELEEDATKSYLPNSHIVLEQCTGLKDKNGRLIYEGDIIRHDTVAGPMHWAVEFKNGCFVLAYESGDAWLMKVIEHCPYDSGVVVVGNIHENPELLEDK